MSNKLYVFIGALLMVAINSNAQTKMSLDDCINYALDNHLSVKNAVLEQEKSKQQIIEAKSHGLPQIDGKIDFMANVKVQSQFVPENAFSPLGDPDKVTPLGFGVPFTTSASVSLTQMIFNGSYFVGLEAARTYETLSDQNVEKTKEDIKVNVTKAYYGSLVNQHRKTLLLANKNQIEELQANAKKMVDAGVMETIELSKLTVSLNNLLTQLEKVAAAQSVSDNVLKFQMGMSQTEVVELTETLENVLTKVELSENPSLIINDRKDFKILETQLILNELSIENQKKASLPSAGFFGAIGANNGAIKIGDLPKFGNWESYGYVGAQINLPLFSSFKQKSLIQQSEIDKKTLLNQIDLAKQSYELEYNQYLENYITYKLSLDRLKENLSLAQKVFENAQIKHKNGIGSNYDIVVAETSLKTAQTDYLGAIYDLLVTKVELDRVSGNL